MARTRRIKKECGTAYHHVMSRTNGRRFILKRPEIKDEMMSILRRTAAFSGVEILAFCLMDDHFHIVCKVTRDEEEQPSESEIVERIAQLQGRKAAEVYAAHWAEMREAGMTEMLEGQLEKWRRRMNDISEFVKTFKETFNIWYKRQNEYCGSIWSGRFKSTLIEDGRYLATCIRYVELNPVRAKMVNAANGYRWSSCRERENAQIQEQRGTVPHREKRGTVPHRGIKVTGGMVSVAYCCIEGMIEDKLLMKRIVQIANGKILGGWEFVTAAIGEHLEQLHGHRVRAKNIVGGVWSSHGFSRAV